MPLSIHQSEALEKGREQVAEVKMKEDINIVKLPTNTPMDFASNSSTSKMRSVEKPKMEKVTQGRIGKVKKSAGQKISEAFLSIDFGSVLQYVINDILVPAAKDTLSDMLHGSTDRILYGDDRVSRRRRSRSYGSPTVISYNKAYSEPNDKRYFRENTQSNTTAARARVRQSFEDIVLDTREDADEVLTKLLEIVDNYGVANIAEFYDMVGLPTTFIDFKYGWDNLNQANIVRVRDGYVVNLPSPSQL